MFGEDGITYVEMKAKNCKNGTDKMTNASEVVHVRCCTFGTILVNWRNAFQPSGYVIVSRLIRCQFDNKQLARP